MSYDNTLFEALRMNLLTVDFAYYFLNDTYNVQGCTLNAELGMKSSIHHRHHRHHHHYPHLTSSLFLPFSGAKG